MTNAHWITNSAAAAEQLRIADEAYEMARLMAKPLPLAEKVVALRNAKAARNAAYAAVANNT